MSEPSDVERWLSGTLDLEAPDLEDPDLLLPDPNPEDELVVTPKGHIRQAGADDIEGAFVQEVKDKCEQFLFVFAKVILGKNLMTWGLHFPFCNWLQRIPPQRKLALMPRDHFKSTIMSQCLPLHVFIQPQDRNPYFPGKRGGDQRILLVCETDDRATEHMSTIKNALTGNDKLRAFWPEIIWDKPRAQADNWSKQKLDIPRSPEYANFADPSLHAIGITTAMTGKHPSMLIKDDLISFKAINEPSTMHLAIEAHKASRALINEAGCLEFMAGTRWAVGDLWEYIIKEDPTVEVIQRSVIENGKPIFPERFPAEVIEQKKAEIGERMFALWYMNTGVDESICDFADQEKIRYFSVIQGLCTYDWRETDDHLSKVWGVKAAGKKHERGARLSLADLDPNTQFEI